MQWSRRHGFTANMAKNKMHNIQREEKQNLGNKEIKKHKSIKVLFKG